MKTTGITRRIDELGRIVIPKEIRKNMHLKTGELLEIFVDSTDEITLKRFSVLNRKEEFLDYYVSFLAKSMHVNVYVTNLSEIVFSNDEDYKNQKIMFDDDLGFLNNGKTNNLSSIKLSNNCILTGNLSVYALRPNADLVGYMIVDFKTEKEKDVISVISFSRVLMENYLEGN